MKKILCSVWFALFTATVAFAATTYTTHYNLSKPSDGSRTWGAELRDNFDEIDLQLWLNAQAIADHIADPTDAHDATAISSDPGLFCTTADTVQEFLDCLDAEIEAAVDGISTSITDHLNDTVDAHDASAISTVSATFCPAATDVQSFLECLDTGLDSFATPYDFSDLDAGAVIFGTGTPSLGEDTDFFWDNTSKFLGIGTQTPMAQLHVSGISSPTHHGIISEQISADTTPARIEMHKSRGTPGAPAIVGNDDYVGTLQFEAYDSADYTPIAAIRSGMDGLAVFGDMPGRLEFRVKDSSTMRERMVIESDGDVAMSSSAIDAEYHLHVQDTSTASDRGVGIELNETTAVSPLLSFRKTRSSFAFPTVVSTADGLGKLDFLGYDGSGYEKAASIEVVTDAGVSAGDMPGAITLSTSPDGSGTPVEAMRVSSDQNVGFGENDPEANVHVVETVTDTERGVLVEQNSSNASGARVVGRKSRGTNATPTVADDEDTVLSLLGRIFNGTGFSSVAELEIVADDTPSVGDTPGKFIFKTVTNGTAVLSDKMVLENRGFLGIGDTTPASRLVVNSNTTPPSAVDQSASEILLRGADTDPTALVVESFGSYPGVYTTRYNGTSSAPATVSDGDILGIYAAKAYNGVGVPTASNASMEFQAAGTWSGFSLGTRILFKTTPQLSTTKQTVFQIREDGSLIGSTLQHGTYAATRTNGDSYVMESGYSSYNCTARTNVDPTPAVIFIWSRMGNVVTGSYTLTVDATAAGLIEVSCAIPVSDGSTNFIDGNRGAGSGADTVSGGGIYAPVHVAARTGTRELNFQTNHFSTIARYFRGSFSYVIP